MRCFQLSSLDDLPALPDSDGQVSFDEILISDDKDGSEEVSDDAGISDV